MDRNRVRLGEGEGTFRRARAALRAWRMFEVGWVRLFPAGAPVETGAVVAVVAEHYGLWSVNPARVVYVFEEEEGGVRRSGFACGTLPRHAQRGEERLCVELHSDGSVFYDLYAFSRPNRLPVWPGYPLVRRLQRRFARDSLAAMARAVG